MDEDGLGPQLNGVSKSNGLKRKREVKNPPSIEEILRKKEEAEKAAAKPRFLSRAERERLAVEAQKQEVEAAKQVQQETAKRWQAQATSEPAPTSRPPPREPPKGPRADRREAKHDKKSAEKESAAHKEYDEWSDMRNRYMGPDLSKSKFKAKKQKKRADKFTFEWGADEDTTIPEKLAGSAVGGRRDGEEEDAILKQARLIRQFDKEHGEERARELLNMKRHAREKAASKQLDVHWSEKALENMRERDWRIFKEDFNISTKGGPLPNPLRSWKESNLPSQILMLIDKIGYKDPSAVQRAAIPIALQNRDLIAVAVTGSGKTAAFLLPLLVYIIDLPPLNKTTFQDGPYGIILAPTRELAQQIEVEANKFAQPLGFRCVSIVGGHSIEEQAWQLQNGAEIIIATPGRLIDCLDRRYLVLSQCCYVIMDEADRMIDMGFEEPVNKILGALPVTNEKPDDERAESAQAMSTLLGNKERYRQTMLYTATMPPGLERIAKKYLRRPAQVLIGNVGEAVDTVEQRVEFIAGEDKRKKRLHELLTMRNEFPPPIIVFVNIKNNCDAVARDVRHWGINAVTLHGSKTQDQREAALGALRRGDAHVLVATDLAGRGIDVPDVSLVINFNMSKSIESYTHRIGRTGRQGKSGVAVTFLGNEDSEVMYDLKQIISKSNISRVPDELRKHPAAQSRKGAITSKGDGAIVN